MTRQPTAHKQSSNMRQAMIIISIIALMVFAFKYGQNVLRYRHLESELKMMDTYVSSVESERTDIDRAFDESLSPANVEEFVRGVLGWVRADEEVIVPIAGNSAAVDDALQSDDSSASARNAPTETQQPNWRLWLNMLMDGE